MVNSCSKASRLVDAPLGGGGHVGADDGEVGQSLQGAPAAPGGALLDLDRADVSFRQVVRPGHGKIDHEPWNHSFVLAEPPRQPQRVAGGGSGAGGVVGDPRCGRAAVEVADPVEGGLVDVVLAGGARGEHRDRCPGRARHGSQG